MTTANRKRFEGDAAIVDKGMGTFLEVGEALARIKESRSYKAAGYATFEACCRERFGWSRQHGYRVIAAATQARSLPAPDMTPVGDKPAVSEYAMRKQREPAERVRSFSKAQQVGARAPQRGVLGHVQVVRQAATVIVEWVESTEDAPRWATDAHAALLVLLRECP